MPRILWEEYFLLLAKVAALRSGCNSRPNGAIIVKNKRILTTGYNGPIPGRWHCTDQGYGYCYRRSLGIPDIDKYNFCPAIHAEANALNQAARFGISVDGSEVYCTLAPCYPCLKDLVAAGIKRVYFESVYESKNLERDTLWNKALKESGVEWNQISLSEETIELASSWMHSITSVRRLAPTD